MPLIDENGFCNSTFWDVAMSWDTTRPRLPLCFEKTALVWTPCLLLWLLTPIEVFNILQSKCKDIPWRFTNTAKLFLNVLLVAISVISLSGSEILEFAGEKVFPVDVWTPVIETATFILSLVLLMWDGIRGRHTSGVLFIFWLSLTVAGVPQLLTEIGQERKGISEEQSFKIILYMIYYPAVVFMFVLNIFPDPLPRVVDYPKYKKMCPQVYSSFASRVVFGWFDKLIWLGFRKPLTVADLWDLRYNDSSNYVVPRFEKHWEEAVKEAEKKASRMKSSTKDEKPTKPREPISVVGPIFQAFKTPILAGICLKLFGDALAFANPQVLSLMIQFVAGKEYMWRGFLYAVTMFVFAELQTLIFHQNLMSMYVLGLNWRTSLISAIYKKALRISNTARKNATVGELVNLMAVDAQRCSDFAPYMIIFFTFPMTIILGAYFLWQLLGPSALAGMAVMITIIPINSYVAKKVKTLQMEQMKYKDERVKLMNEVLSGIKVLKMYAWEPSFMDQVTKIREQEMSVLKSAAFWNASTSFIWLCSSFLVSLATFSVFVLVDERNVLTSEIAFVATALFNVMRAPLYFLPLMVQILVQCLVSIKRINKFLNAEELDLTSVSHDESRKEQLVIENGNFSWGRHETDATVLRNITLRVQPGSLVAVVGAVGCGKSSLISAFLGEMDKLSGYVNTKGTISYVPQQAWIQNASVRDNILFGKEFNSKKYYRTVEVCALQQDFEMLPGGDATEIGEKGINLSGGQKQRVSLARAVYNNADTYLLDDPLSAVDSHVGKHIFDNVIGPQGVLNGKTRVLVTHGLTFLQQVDVIVVMKGGEITEMGTFKELLAEKGEFSDFLVQYLTEYSDPELQPELEEIIDEHAVLKNHLKAALSRSSSLRSTSSSVSRRKDSQVVENATSQIDKLIQAEKTETGSVEWSVYMHYFRSAGLLFSFGALGFQVLAQVFTIAGNFSLTDWTADPLAVVDGLQNLARRNYHLEVYFGFGIGQMLAVIASAFSLAVATYMASRHLHMSMLSNVLHSPMSFFDTTPSGRIVNRFGKDVEVVDNTLPFNMSNGLSCFGNVFGTVAVIIVSTPLFSSVIVPIGLLYYLVQKFYVTTSRQLKRIESVSRSPMYSHFSETVTGVSSIRAYGVKERFIKTSEERVDANQVCQYPSLVSNRWLGIRLETIGNFLIFFAALFAVLERDSLDPGIVGLSISYALQITGILNYAVRMSSEVETNIVAVERIKEYAEIPQEAAWEVQPRPSPNWPTHGTVRFNDYQVRYRPGLPLVLKGVSCTINGGEKIGIVGRTGAGKSSLTLCLFRILEAAGGSIYIDGLDISKIGLGDLRSKLTIIPQDPVLFSGTLRMNLDPFEVYNDSDIWAALQLSLLSDFVQSIPLGLSHLINEGGENLSVGQRQLVCLARALLRKTQVLILDEATASIDLETDDLIQKIIRKEFRDCTVLTIAHRLNTIMDSDRVIVLDNGLVREFDLPQTLLQSQKSIFYGMAKDAGLV